MAFFDKLNAFAQNITDKTNDAIETGKLNSKITSEKNLAGEELKKIGTYYYEKFANGEEVDPAILEFCNAAQAHYVAAGALENGFADIVGFGRMAFAYDTFAKDMIADKFNADKTCITCSKCTELMRHGSVTGCPIRDQEIYLPIYRKVVLGK